MSERSYQAFLQPGEIAENMPTPEHGSQEWAYGYEIAVIEHSTNEAGNSVILDIETHGATEPVLIDAELELSVKTLQGTGYAVIYNIETQDSVRIVEMNPVSDPVELVKGDAYFYLNSGTDRFILRDDATPAFKDGDELLFTDVKAERSQDRSTVELPVAFLKAFGALRDKSPEEVNQIALREVRPKDYEDLVQIIEHWIPNPKVRDSITEQVTADLDHSLSGHTQDTYLVAEDILGQPVGMMGLQDLDARLHGYVSSPDNSKQLVSAYVDPAQVGKGIGRTMAQALESISVGQDIVVVSGPICRDGGWGFWTKLYGEPIDEIPDYFEPDVQAMVWRKPQPEEHVITPREP